VDGRRFRVESAFGRTPGSGQSLVPGALQAGTDLHRAYYRVREEETDALCFAKQYSILRDAETMTAIDGVAAPESARHEFARMRSAAGPGVPEALACDNRTLVMAHVEGLPLHEMLRRGAIHRRHAPGIVNAVLAGVEQLQSRIGLDGYDLNLNNILYETGANRVWFIDFERARCNPIDRCRTMVATVLRAAGGEPT
jgi:RIO-like serine/threonine protein kinase